MDSIDFTPTGWTDTLDLGQGLRFLVYEDCYRLAHPCKTVEVDAGHREARLIIAPDLSNHTVSVVYHDSRVVNVNVEPSIACPDCNLHGHLHGSKWFPVTGSQWKAPE
jgi:hypothetical protein